MKTLYAPLLGAFALAATAFAPLSDAEAGAPGWQVAKRLDRIAYQITDLRDIRNARQRGAEIDRYQTILRNLAHHSSKQPGRVARQNELEIERLQRRLSRIERRHERRSDRRDYRRDNRRGNSANGRYRNY